VIALLGGEGGLRGGEIVALEWSDIALERRQIARLRDLLGHASITTTERYDNQKLENLQAAVLKLEREKTFDPKVRLKADATTDTTEAGRHDDGLAPPKRRNATNAPRRRDKVLSFFQRSGESRDDRRSKSRS
jgi:hypothetical protein